MSTETQRPEYVCPECRESLGSGDTGIDIWWWCDECARVWMTVGGGSDV